MHEVIFQFKPSMQTIELLSESLEHLPYLELNDGVPYSGKFRRLKSLRLRDDRFDFYKIKVFRFFYHFHTITILD